MLGINRNSKQKYFLKFILSDKHLDGAGRSLRHILDKVKLWHFHITSNEVMWPKKFSNYMQGLKTFWQFFILGRDGRALLVLPQESLTRFQKLFLQWVPMNS